MAKQQQKSNKTFVYIVLRGPNRDVVIGCPKVIVRPTNINIHQIVLSQQ